MDKKKIGILITCVLIGFVYILWPKQEKIEEPIDLQKEEVVVNRMQVEIKGAVKKPGVYELEQDSRVKDIIEKSGGLLENADISTINLSKQLEDEMVVIIYTKEEIAEMKKGSTSVKYIDNICVCPQIKNDACIDNKVTNIDQEETTTPKGKVSINKASLQELMGVSGIGEVKAKAIIAYREANGGFKSIEEITKVKGIGKTTYDKIKEFITL